MLYRKRIGYAMANIEKSSHRSAQIMNYYGTPQSQSASFPAKNRKVLNGRNLQLYVCRSREKTSADLALFKMNKVFLFVDF